MRADEPLSDPTWESESSPGSPTSVESRVGRRVEFAPGHAAVIDTDGTVTTYAELWRTSGELARRLPVTDGEVVGVEMSRGTNVVIAMLAVLRAGGVYCPTSPDDPAIRTRHLQDRVGVRYVLDEDERGSIHLTERNEPPRVIEVSPGGDRPIYVMWTSGSTGEPKAVVISHRGVVRLIDDRTLMELGPDDRVAFASNPMFDATTWEVWATLGNGATVVVVDPDDLVHANRLRRRLEQTGVTRLFLTTSLFDQHATRDPSMFGGLRTLAVGGEPMRTRTVRAVLTSVAPPTRFLNVYGPTECTTFATGHPIERETLGTTSVPIGTPLLGTRTAIVDGRGREVGSGSEGELWLGGDGVALGYLGVDGIEQDRFVAAGFDDRAPNRWYRTGDLVRSTDDGTIEFLGRVDRQVKIRGYRIEPVEVEQAIERCEGVWEVAVVADRSSEIVRLCAFVVALPNGVDSEASLAERIRSHLRRALPAYMIPTRIVVVDELPITRNGKLDVDALLSLVDDTARDGAPTDEEWRHLAPVAADVTDLARTVLGRRDLRPTDDLWDAGLDSLAAVELAVALSELLDREVHPSEFVDHRTPSTIAVARGSHRSATGVDVTVLGSDRSLDPVFAVVGGGTPALALRQLAPPLHSGRRSLVVIEPGGARSTRHTRRRVERMADRVVAEVEAQRPHGPLVLAGWSAGGVIATHAASRLEQRGRIVRLVLFDTVFLSKGIRAAFTLAATRQLLRGNRLRTPFRRPTDDPDRPPSDDLRMLGLKAASIRTLHRYGTPPPLRGPVLHLHVAESLAARSVISAIPDCTSTVVPGDHISMFDATNSPALASAMLAWLAAVESLDHPEASPGSTDQQRPTPS